MDSRIELDSYKDIIKPNISLVENFAKHAQRISKIERIVNCALIFFENLLYLIVFLWFFQAKVSPNFPEFSLYQPGDWFKNNTVVDDYLFFLILIYGIYNILLSNYGLQRLYSETSLIDDIFRIIKSICISFVITIGILFLCKTSMVYSRVLIVGYAGSMIAIAIIVRMIKRKIVMELKKANLFTKNVLIIGAGKIGEQVKSFLTQNKTNGYNVFGFLDDFKQDKQIVGEINQLEYIIQSARINSIYITIPSERKVINNLIRRIRKYNVEIKIIPEMYDFVSSNLQFQNTAGLFPYLEIMKTPLRGINLLLKRFVDIMLSFVGILILSPLLLSVSVLIKLDSKGPVLFKQKRIGKNGVAFNMYKFRSMITNAEELKQELEKYNEASGPVFKMKNDPRITRFGRFIRKYSIDELPQLFNVLIGNMSLIGPRPSLRKEVEQYDDFQWNRLDIRPGITGLWQVSGRSDLSFDEWVNLDVYYIENWSIALDLKIILKTLPVVVNGKGAY